MRSPALRVKLKTLAAESLIIKREMLKFKTSNPWYERLHLHRVHDVREEARATNIAYGFLNGLSYSEIETCSYSPPKWDRVYAMVKKYGEVGTDTERTDALTEWKKTTQDNKGMYRPVLPEIEITEISLDVTGTDVSQD